MNTFIDNKSQRYYWISFAQLFAMVLIVLSHSVPEGVAVPVFISAMTPYLQYAGLTVFMCTSGYLAAKTKSLEKYGYTRYIKKRAVRLLVPYFVVSLLMLIPKYVLAAYAHSEVSLNPVLILVQLVTPREGILPHLWFLPTLMVLSCALPIWIWATKRAVSILFCAVMLIGLQFIPRITNVACIDDIIDYALWFFMGITAAERMKALTRRTKAILAMSIIPVGGGVSA